MSVTPRWSRNLGLSGRAFRKAGNPRPSGGWSCETRRKTLYFKDGTTLPYDLCVLVPPYRGIKALEDSGLTDERGFISADWNTWRADHSIHRNIYAVGDCIGNPGPIQGHLALMQATVAAEHIAWRINRKGSVRAYLPEFRCVMVQGGGEGLYLYSQYMSDGDVMEIKLGTEPYASKSAYIRFSPPAK